MDGKLSCWPRNINNEVGAIETDAPPQRSLKNWGDQKWLTKSGKKSSVTGERNLPEKAIKALSSAEYAATTAAKRRDKKRANNSQNNLSRSWQRPEAIEIRFDSYFMHTVCLTCSSLNWSKFTLTNGCENAASGLRSIHSIFHIR